jgi:hypothetical protein
MSLLAFIPGCDPSNIRLEVVGHLPTVLGVVEVVVSERDSLVLADFPGFDQLSTGSL